MRFWDSSAIVPLLVTEASTKAVRAAWLRAPSMAVWWATPVECLSALCRLERDGALSTNGLRDAIARLDALSAAWLEIEAGPRVRELAMRLLRTHALRAADSLQLAAAIVAAEERPATLDIVTLDARLADAAGREGFAVELPASIGR